MCGLVGILDTTGRRDIDRGLLRRMNESQHHRGPDEGGLHLEPGLGLAHRRLSIIDLSTGQQPLYNEDGSVVVVYNGEIYNFQALMAELQAAGHSFRTRSDTEVIVHGWEQWGEACVERFRGMFAFALWDANREQLFLARDRLGIKPLYYAALEDGTLVFGSELKALRAHPGCPTAIDPLAVEEYLGFGYVPEPRTIFRRVSKLPPATRMVVARGRELPEPYPYWDVSFAAGPAAAGADLEAELLARLEEAVRIRMIAEVPLGAFLSGGVDSSAVVATMARISEREVNTCSISFGDPRYNESAYAAMVAEGYQTDHQVGQVEPEDFSLVDRLAGLYDEPYADSSAIPTYRVCELARRRVTVALSGDGGDENFAGYTRYRWHMQDQRRRALFPDGLRRPLFGALGRLYPSLPGAPPRLRAKATLQSIARDPLEGYFHNVAVVGDALRQGLYSESFRRELGAYRAIEVLRRHAAGAPTDDPLSLVQYLDMKTYLPGDILTKVDRASMAHALEVRVPLLDHELVDWVSTLPPEIKLRGREGKYLFKKALEPLLPEEVLYRPKMGFAVPLAGWFRGPLRERVREALLGPTLAATGIFARKPLERLIEAHRQGADEHTQVIWSLLMLESFQRSLEAP